MRKRGRKTRKTKRDLMEHNVEKGEKGGNKRLYERFFERKRNYS